MKNIEMGSGTRCSRITYLKCLMHEQHYSSEPIRMNPKYFMELVSSFVHGQKFTRH